MFERIQEVNGFLARAKSSPADAAPVHVVAERWEMPDGGKLLELSIKCPPQEAAVARKAFEGFLAGHGLDAHGVQKTKTALESFAKRLKSP